MQKYKQRNVDMANHTFNAGKILPDNILIQKLRQAAKVYQNYADLDVLIVYAKTKEGPFHYYQFHAGIENFQHLAGIKSPKGAVWFFNKCLDTENVLKKEDIVPKENLKTTSAKISVLPEAVDLTKAKAYKLGEKDLITINNRFHMAIGNKSHIMGFDQRTYYLPVPVTVMDRSLYDFCTYGFKISLIMTKTVDEEKYSNIFYEISSDILKKAVFGNDILNLIDYIDNSSICKKEEVSKAIFAEVAVTIN